jgi:hypothetical protein
VDCVKAERVLGEQNLQRVTHVKLKWVVGLRVDVDTNYFKPCPVIPNSGPACASEQV